MEELETKKPYAQFTSRYAASVLDGLIVGIFGLVAGLVLGLMGYQPDSLFVNLVGAVISFSYAVILLKKHNATWGKKFFKLKVETIDGKEMTWGKAFVREVLGKIVSSLVVMIGYVWFFFDKKKQTWHDKFAHTIVVQTEPLSKGRKILAFILAYGLVLIVLLGILAVVAVALQGPLKDPTMNIPTMEGQGSTYETVPAESGEVPDINE
jgi:uncharacterized RDD family membrane protein YckC